MNPRAAIVALGVSLAIAVLAAIDGWLVVTVALTWGLPVDATSVLSVVVMGLTCFVGCGFAAGRMSDGSRVSDALLAAGPTLIGVLNAALSTAPPWFRLLNLVLLLGGALAGIATGIRTARRSRVDRRFSLQH